MKKLVSAFALVACVGVLGAGAQQSTCGFLSYKSTEIANW